MAGDREIGRLVVKLIAEVESLKKGLSEAQNSIKTFTEKTKASGKEYESTIAGIKASYLKVAAVAYSTFKTISTTMDWAKLGAQAQAVEQSFANLTRSIGVDGKALIDEMRRISGVWVEHTGVMVKAQRLLAEGMKPDEIINLTRASVVAAKMMGVEVSEAFDRVTEAVITLRTRSLKAAFPMEEREVMERYAKSIGTVAEYLSEAGRRQAIYNEIVSQTIEKERMLGDAMVPTNYDKIQKYQSAIAQLREEIGKATANAVIPLVESLINMNNTIETSLPGVRNFIKEWFIASTPAGGLGAAYIAINKLKTAISKLRPTGTEPPPETRFTIPYKQTIEQIEAEEKRNKALREKSKIEDKKLQEDLMRFRLTQLQQRQQVEFNIIRQQLEMQKNLEIAELKKTGQSTLEVELEWNRRIAEAEYQATIKNLETRRKLEIAEAVRAGMDVQAVREKFNMMEKEAAIKLASELAEISIKRASSLEALWGMTEEEFQKRLEYSRALHEGDLDEWMRANRVKEAEEARLQAQIIQNQIAEDQFRMTKEERLRKEIEITNELLSRAQERLNVLSEEDEAYVAIYQQVENYKNKLSELNYELERQTATFDQLVVMGLKKYSVNLQQDVIHQMENLLPQAIEIASSSFKTLFRDLTNGTKSASDAFKDFARNFGESIMDMIVDITLLIAKTEILKALNISQPTGGTGGGGGGGGWLGLITNLVGLIGGLFQSGGQIKGPAGIDRVPIRATAGEYIHPVSAVKYYGLDIMEKIRTKAIPREVLLSLSSGKSISNKVIPSLAMQTGGIVPSITMEGTQTEKRNEITLINVIDPREMDAWAASARGQNAIINVISSRADTVRRILT